MKTGMKKSTQRDAFIQTYGDYYALVFNAIYTKVNSREDANDIAQEVFMAFYNKIEEVENPRKWLLGTLNNMVLKYYRKKNPHEDIENFFEDVSLTFVNGFRDSRIVIQEAIEDIEATEEERILLDLIAFHNYSYDDTASILGLTKRIVGYKYNQVVNKIIQSLKSKGIEKLEDLL